MSPKKPFVWGVEWGSKLCSITSEHLGCMFRQDLSSLNLGCLGIPLVSSVEITLECSVRTNK